jgi:hypothetical protein
LVVPHKIGQAFSETLAEMVETGESIARAVSEKRNGIGPSGSLNTSEAWEKTVAIKRSEANLRSPGESLQTKV